MSISSFVEDCTFEQPEGSDLVLTLFEVEDFNRAEALELCRRCHKSVLPQPIDVAQGLELVSFVQSKVDFSPFFLGIMDEDGIEGEGP